MMKNLGLVVGQGELPRALAQEAKRQGYSVVAVALEGVTDASVEEYADKVGWFKPGRMGAMINFLKENRVEGLVSAGKIPKSILFRSALSPDMRLITFLFRLRTRGDDSIITGLSREIERDGIKLLDMRDFARDLLMPEGTLTRRAPDREEWKDIEYGMMIAKEIGRLEIGQTVVVKDMAVMAVEAMEGTDEAIGRGGRLAGGGATVVKVSRPAQDMRFDVPVVGLRTLGVMKESGVSVLALEAEKSIFFQREEFIAEADAAGIAVVGLRYKKKPA